METSAYVGTTEILNHLTGGRFNDNFQSTIVLITDLECGPLLEIKVDRRHLIQVIEDAIYECSLESIVDFFTLLFSPEEGYQLYSDEDTYEECYANNLDARSQ